MVRWSDRRKRHQSAGQRPVEPRNRTCASRALLIHSPQHCRPQDRDPVLHSSPSGGNASSSICLSVFLIPDSLIPDPCLFVMV